MKSILYKDKNATEIEDKKLISYLVFNLLSRKKDDFHNKCVDKIMETIQTKEWKLKYKSSHFIHIVDIYSRENYGELKFMWMCQVLELLYFFIIYNSPNPSSAKLSEIHFYDKLGDLYKYFYNGREIRAENSKIIKMLRNSVAHTGTLEVIEETLGKEDLGSFKKAKENNINLRELALSFDLLVADMFLRCLGLEDDEMYVNGVPPQFLNIFKN